MKFLLIISILFIVKLDVQAQFIEKTFKLSNELKEVSGIALLKDTVLIAINDSDNGPVIFFLNLKGEIFQKSLINGATNVDWEDILIQDSILYIGDIGNNNSTRKNLCVYIVDIKNWIGIKEFNSQKIEFSYKEQTEFPPVEGSIKFDCEAMYYSNGNLKLVSKSIEEPWIGTSRIYPLPIVPGKYEIQSSNSVHIDSKIWPGGAITSCVSDDSTITFLTYGKLVQFDKINLLSQLSTYNFGKRTQKEGVCQLNENTFYVVSEKNKILGGPYLTILIRKK